MSSTVAPERGCWQALGSFAHMCDGFAHSRLVLTSIRSKSVVLVLAVAIPAKGANDKQGDESFQLSV